MNKVVLGQYALGEYFLGIGDNLKAIEAFRKEWNEKLGCYRDKSYHDWASHGSKALIYCSEAVQRTGSAAGMSAEEWARMRKEWL